MIYASGILMDIDAQVKSEQVAARQASELENQRTALQTLYDTIPCGIMQFKAGDITKGSLGLISFNDTAWKIFGYPDREAYVEAVRGNNKLKDVHPDDLEGVKGCIARACQSKGNERVDCDHRIVRTDGSVRWVQALFQKVSGGAGGDERIQVVFSDITDRKHESQRRVNNTLLSIYDEVFEINAELGVCFIRYSKHSGRGIEGTILSLDDYLSSLCRSAHPEDAAKIREFYNGAGRRAADAPSRLEYRRAGGEGSIRWISTMRLPISGPTYLACERDVTEIKNAQRLARENENLQLLVNERRREDERNRIFIENTGAQIYDYDIASDKLTIQRRSAGGAIVNETDDNYFEKLMDNPAIKAVDREKMRDVFIKAMAAPVRQTLEYGTDRFGNGFVPCRAQIVSIADESGKVYRILGQISEIQDEKTRILSEKLKAITGCDYKKLPFHHLAVDDILRTLESAADSRAAVRDMLAAAGRQFNVSRAYVIEEDGDGGHCSNTFEWCAEDVPPEIDNLQHYKYPDGIRGNYISMFDDEGLWSCSDTSELTGWLREALEPQGIRAIVQCAIMEAGAFRGYVGFDECRETRKWTEMQKNTLRVISNIIGAFLFANRSKNTAELPEETLSAMDSNPAYAYIIDPDTCRVLYCNSALKAATGMTGAGGEVCYKVFANREAMCERCPITELGKAGVPLPTLTLRDGRTYIMQASPFIWDGRKAMLISGTDESCFADDPDKARRAKYRQDLHRYAGALIGLYDEVFEFNFTDDAFTSLHTKYPRSFTEGRPASLSETIRVWSERFVHSEDRAALAAFLDIRHIQKLFRGGGAPTLTYRVVLPDGTQRSCQGTLLRLDAGRYLYCTKDVTEHMDAERMKENLLVLQSQAEAQDSYRVVVEQTGAAVFEINYRTGRFSCSEAYHKYASSRCRYHETPANICDRRFVHEDDHKLLDKFLADTESGAPYAETVLRVRMEDQSFRWTKMAGTFIRDEGGQLLRTVGTFTDVDDEVRAKTALNEISSRMRQIIANVPAGVAIYEIREKNVYPIYTSDRTCEMFGFTRNECNLRIANSEPIGFMPNLKALPQGSVEKMLSGQPLVIRRERAHRKDGGEFWLRATYSMNKKEDGTTLCYAILADVSAEVENEQKYMLQAEMYKILSESADMITFDYAPQEDVMRIVMINPAGGSSEEVVERYMKKVLTNDHIQEDTRDSFLDTLKLASSAPTRGTFDFQWDYYGNGMRWYRAKYVSLADDEGAVYRVVGRLDDISDIKRAERGSLSERKDGSAGPAPEEGQR